MNRSELLALISSKLPSNSTGQITAADVREVFSALAASGFNLDEDSLAVIGAEVAGTAASAIASHGAAADPHTQYLLDSQRGSANGVASLGADGKVPSSQLPAEGTGTLTSHASSHASGGTDAISPSSIGAEVAGTAASAIASHGAAADPHPQYLLDSQRGSANGVASLGADGKVPSSQLTDLPIIAHDPGDSGNFSALTVVGNDITITPFTNTNEWIANGNSAWWNFFCRVANLSGKTGYQFSIPMANFVFTRAGFTDTPATTIVQNFQPVWSVDLKNWFQFETYSQEGSTYANTIKKCLDARIYNLGEVYVSSCRAVLINQYFDWIENIVKLNQYIRSTISEIEEGSLIVQKQNGGTVNGKLVPSLPIYGFRIVSAGAPRGLAIFTGHQHAGENDLCIFQELVRTICGNSDLGIAYRAKYESIIYPHLNPTGQWAGVLRGTGYDPNLDLNRKWGTGTASQVTAFINILYADIDAVLAQFPAIGQTTAIIDFHGTPWFSSSENNGKDMVYKNTDINPVLHTQFADGLISAIGANSFVSINKTVAGSGNILRGWGCNPRPTGGNSKISVTIEAAPYRADHLSGKSEQLARAIVKSLVDLSI